MTPLPPERANVIVELAQPLPPEARVVVAAALQLFGPQDPVDVVLVLDGVDEPAEEEGQQVLELCLSVAGGTLPEIVLAGETEAAALLSLTRVRAGADAAGNARSVVRLSAAARSVYAAHEQPTAAPVPGPSGKAPTAAQERTLVELAIARRDARAAIACATGVRRPLVVVVFQHRSYWGAVATLVEALRARPGLDVEVVALDSPTGGGPGSTAAFLARQGVQARGPEWFSACRDDVDVVVLDNPYDEFRPVGLRVPDLVDAGTRLVAVPYGSNAIAGELMETLLWDLPLQRAAWRAYLTSQEQRRLFAEHCRAGADQVRVLGAPKSDRVLRPGLSPRARQLRALAAGRPLVLWNPHFRVGPGGWSTFTTYLRPLLERFADDDAVLLVRPHFRLFGDLARLGGELAELEGELRRAVTARQNIVLDEEPDGLDALQACDAMMTDLSGLACELLPTGKPLLYLHRADGPGPNAEGAYFACMYRADGWRDVEAFLDGPARGQDPQAEQRAAVSRDLLPWSDGRAGVRLARDVEQSLRTELGLEPSGLEPPATVSLTPLRLSVDRLSVRLSGASAGARLALSGPVEVSVELPSRSDDLVVEVPLRQQTGQAAGQPLPPGTYALRLVGVPGYVLAPEAWDRRHELRARNSRGVVRAVRRSRRELGLEVEGPELHVTPAQGQRSFAGAARRPLEHSVVLTSFDGRSGCNPQALAEELDRVGHDAVRHWVVRDHSVPVPRGCRPLLRGSAEWYERLARAQWVVDNDAMPAFLRKRPGQVFVQTWHGTPLKLLRWDLDELSPRDPGYMAYADRDAGQWDVALSPSPLLSEVLRRAFRFSGDVLELGYPRNDVLCDVARREAVARRVRADLAVPEGARLVLHAPTWRDDQSTGGGAVDLDPGRLADALGDGSTVLWRGHRFTSGAPTQGLRSVRARDVSAHPDMAELLAAADLLVTDYSSSMFDFALTGRPMAFFVPDLQQYRDRTRGAYFRMEERVPGPLATSFDALVASVEQQAGGVPDGRYEAFVKEFAPWDDGRAAARVVDSVFT